MFSDGWLQTGNYLHNPLQPLNSFGLKKSELKQGLHRNSTSWSVWRTERSIWNSAYRSQFRQKQKRSRSPAGPRRLGTATRMSASLSRRLSAFFESASGQGPKAAKFAALPPGHAGFPKRAERSEGSDTTPTSNTTCFAVCALDVAILEVSCYTDGHRKLLKNFFIFFENRVRNGAARASI